MNVPHAGRAAWQAVLRFMGRPRQAVAGRPMVFAALFCVFAFAFLGAPYWLLFKAVPGPWVSLGLVSLLGLGWAWTGSGTLRVRMDPWSAAAFLLIGGATLALCFPALTLDIPWRGDEGYHVAMVARLYHRGLALAARWNGVVVALAACAALAALAAVLIVVVRRRLLPSWLVLLAASWAGCVVAGLLFDRPEVVLRYPFLSKWLSLAGACVAGLAGSPWAESHYRIVPLLSTVLLAWYCQRSMPAGVAVRALVAAAVMTLPIIRFYTSLLYLEMPAVFLMTVVCMNADAVVRKSFESLKEHAAWYALAGIGFVKETVAPFLFVACGMRWLRALASVRAGGMRAACRRFFEETAVTLFAGLPLALYLVCRMSNEQTRPYGGNLANLLDPGSYAILLRSLGEQFGLFLLPAIFGLYRMVRRGEYLRLSFLLACLAAHAGFQLMDDALYVGYARFNLFFAPPILASGILGILELARWRARWCAAALLALTAANLWMAPVDHTGERRAGWGTYRYDVAEQYYPFKTAIQWIRDNLPGRRVLAAGMRNHYPFEFYFEGYDRHEPLYCDTDAPEDAPRVLADALRAADEGQFGAVLFFAPGDASPQPPAGTPFDACRTFARGSKRLVVYWRGQAGGAGAGR